METLEGRLASFRLQPAKRRANEPYADTPVWPHHPTRFSVTPATLAAAGFYHDPTESAPDNVTCIYCSKGLEGWEQGDDALDEHLKRVLDKNTEAKCPWATIMGVKRDFELFGPDELDAGKHDPSADYLVTARKETFGHWWKFDGRKGWKPTSDRLAQAGFYSNPLVDAPDTCACAYCLVQLDGWSKNDDPEEEHKSREPDCFFFAAKAQNVALVNKHISKAATSNRRNLRERNVIIASAEKEVEPDALAKPAESTSSRKKTGKKRSATSTSISHDPEPSKSHKSDAVITAEESPSTLAQQTQRNDGAAKSRKSRAATATKKIKSKPGDTGTIVTEPANIHLREEGEVTEDPTESVLHGKGRKRTTRHTAVATTAPKNAKVANKTLIKSKSKRVNVLEQEYTSQSEAEMPIESSVEVEEAELEGGISIVDAPPVPATSRSGTGTRTTRAQARKVEPPLPQDKDNTYAEGHLAPEETDGRAAISGGAMYPSSPRDDSEVSHTHTVKLLQRLPDKTLSSATVSAVAEGNSPRSEEVASNRKRPLKTRSTRASSKAPTAKNSARSKAHISVAEPLDLPSQSESSMDEAETNSESLTNTSEPALQVTASTSEQEDKATPKAGSTGGKFARRVESNNAKPTIPDLLPDSSYRPPVDEDATSVTTSAAIRPAKPSFEGCSEQEPTDNATSAVRPPSQQTQVSPDALRTTTNGPVVPSQRSRGQTALDALLAASPPTFDSPVKPIATPQARSFPSPGVLSPVNPNAQQPGLQTLSMPSLADHGNITVREWIAALRDQELERFTRESVHILNEFDMHTERNRKQLASLLEQTCS